MADTDDVDLVGLFYEFMEPMLGRVAGSLVDDHDEAMVEARSHFEGMAPNLAYRNDPQHPMASAVFSCASSLAVYLALRDRGVEAHDFGRALHDEFAQMPMPPEPMTDRSLTDAAAQSQRDADKGEFVFEVIGSPEDTRWAMNIKSCGICSLYSQFNAMDLVPYMCALDDLFSDRAGHGLRRTGTIALGATHCDFRYDAAGEPLRLVEQYPVQIQLRPSTA